MNEAQRFLLNKNVDDRCLDFNRNYYLSDLLMDFVESCRPNDAEFIAQVAKLNSNAIVYNIRYRTDTAGSTNWKNEE